MIHRVEATRRAMSTSVAVIVEDRSQDRAREALERALQEMERLETLLTRFEEGAPLGTLNSSGRLADPPAELRAVLAHGLDLHRRSVGAFDPTVAPLVDLYQVHFAAHGGPPDAAELRELRALVGAEHVRLEDRGLRLEREGMALTLDGIAKGFVVDRMMETIAALGLRHALVNAGGDIRALGSRADERPWRVGVQDPRKPEAMVEVIDLADEAVATSGDYARFHDVERRCHHTILPATGRSPDVLASVTVRTRTAMEADALATAVFVLGPDAGLTLLDSCGAGGLLIARAGSKRISRLWRLSGRT